MHRTDLPESKTELWTRSKSGACVILEELSLSFCLSEISCILHPFHREDSLSGSRNVLCLRSFSRLQSSWFLWDSFTFFLSVSKMTGLSRTHFSKNFLREKNLSFSDMRSKCVLRAVSVCKCVPCSHGGQKRSVLRVWRRVRTRTKNEKERLPS